MVSSTGPISTPYPRKTHMSYLMFWPTFSTDGSSSNGFSLAIALSSASWPGNSLPSLSLAAVAARSSEPCAAATGSRWPSGR